MDENKKKMLEGKIYDPFIGDLQQERINCHNLCLEYNQLKDLDPRKDEIIKILFPDSEHKSAHPDEQCDKKHAGSRTHCGNDIKVKERKPQSESSVSFYALTVKNVEQ